MPLTARALIVTCVTTTIIGREEELAAIHAFLREEIPQPSALAIEGEAGIGKSTLWLAALRMGGEVGARVLSSRPAEAERGLAYAGLGDLFEGVLADVSPSLSAPRRNALEGALLVREADAASDPRALGVAVRNALELLSARERIVLAIDDVQWLDASSAEALSFALRRIESRVSLVLARRSSEGGTPAGLEDALVPGSTTRIHVRPLSAGATQAIVLHHLDRAFPRPVLLRLHEMSGGNPFYALEIARALPENVDPTQPLPVPETLEGVLRYRLAALPRTALAALALVAVLGTASRALLHEAGVDESGLELALDAGVLELEGRDVRFSHPLIAAAVYQGLGPAQRRRTHRDVAAVVSDPLERARHSALAASRPEAATAALVEEAALRASTHGVAAVGAELHEHALRLTPSADAEARRRRTIATARAHLATANVARARALSRELLERSPAGSPRAEALVLEADAASNLKDALRLLKAALEEKPADPRLCTEIHDRLGWDARFSEGLSSAEAHARAALELSEGIADESLRASTMATYSTIRFHLGQSDALPLAAQAYELARAEARRDDLMQVTLVVSSTYLWSGHLDRARALLGELLPEWDDRDEGVVAQIEWRLACIELVAGRLVSAAVHAERAFEINAEYGGSDSAVAWAVANIAALRGDFERAQETLDSRSRHLEGSPWFVPHFETVRGVVASLQEAPERAVEHFARAEAGLAAIGSREPNLARWRADYIETLLRLGRVDDALALLEPWEAEGARLGREPVLAQALRCRGLVAATRGDIALASSLLDEAAAKHAAAGDELGRGRALLALGVARRRARQKRASREALSDALGVLVECGATPWVERARSELARIGGRTRQEGLTPAERRVAALVAEGRTNREVAAMLFLGERTVETHLSHVYAKLGIRSRTELARAYDPTA